MFSVKFCRSALDQFCSQITWIYAFNEDIGGSVPEIRPILLNGTIEPSRQTAIWLKIVKLVSLILARLFYLVKT